MWAGKLADETHPKRAIHPAGWPTHARREVIISIIYLTWNRVVVVDAPLVQLKYSTDVLLATRTCRHLGTTMARKMSTARTGKRRKKQKKVRKLKQDEEENAQESEAVNMSPESGAEDAGSRDNAALESGASESRELESSKNVDEPYRGEDGGSDHKGDARSGDELVSEISKGEDEEEEEEEEGEKQERPGEEEKSEGEEESDESPEDISLTKGKVMAMEQQKNEGEEIKR